jgi:hypothetical protein
MALCCAFRLGGDNVADFETYYREFLVDLNGDGRIDANEQGIAATRAQQAAGPLSNKDRQRISRGAMAGREPSAVDQGRLQADQGRLDDNTSHLVTQGANIAANMYAPGTMAFLSGMAPTPVAAADQPGGVATPDQLDAEAKANASRRAAEPNLVDQLVSLFKGKSFSAPDFEQFRQSRLAANPPPKPLSETEYVAQQVDAFRKSPAYQTLVQNGSTKTAEARAAAAGKAALEGYTGYTNRTAGELQRWNEQVKQEYEALKGELNTQETAYNNQNFATRNPTAAAALTAGPLVLGALASRKGFKTYNQQGEKLMEMAAKSRAAGDTAGELAAQRALETWKNSDYYTTIAKQAGKVAGGSVAGRGFMDMSDRYLMPEGSGARDAVKKKFTVDNLQNIGVEYGLNALAGLEAPAIGAMMTKGGPRSLVNAELARIAPGFYDEAAKAATNQQNLLTAQQPLIALNKQTEAMASAKAPKITYAPQQVQLPPPQLPPTPPGSPPGGTGALPPAQPALNGQTPPQNLPPTPPPGSASSRVGYGQEKQALVRPFIESEIAAGRNVPAIPDVENLLMQNGMNGLPKGFQERLDAVDAIAQSLRKQGLSEDQIARAVRSAMDVGTRGLPAAAGAGAVYNYATGGEDGPGPLIVPIGPSHRGNLLMQGY